MLIHILSVVAFMVVSFAAQGLSHFVVNSDHFAAIEHLRKDPIIPLGLLAMVMQGAIMSVALSVWREGDATVGSGLVVAVAFGLFLIAYISLVEPAKYTVPDIASWMRIETIVGVAQFTVFGVLLGLIHSKFG